jgi:protein SCO1
MNAGASTLKSRLLIISAIFLAIFLAAYGILAYTHESITPRPTSLPIFGQGLAETSTGFVFEDQNGGTFNTKIMAKKIWLVNFFFTSCPGPCPLMTAQIAGVMAKNETIHALSITTDPETDTPSVLKTYAERFKADPSRWFMVRGDQPTIITFGRDVLKLPTGEAADAHSSRIVLIDGRGQIRAWYDSQDPELRKTILRDISELR